MVLAGVQVLPDLDRFLFPAARCHQVEMHGQDRQRVLGERRGVDHLEEEGQDAGEQGQPRDLRSVKAIEYPRYPRYPRSQGTTYFALEVFSNVCMLKDRGVPALEYPGYQHTTHCIIPKLVKYIA